MGRRTLLINVALLAAVLLGAVYFVSQWRSYEAGNNLIALVQSGPAGEGPPEADLGERELRRQVTAFETIDEKPLFRPERRRPEEVSEVEEVRPDPPAMEMTGSSVFGGQARATVKVAPSNRRGSEQTITVGVGDAPQQLDGWRVASVESTAVTLQWNDEQIVYDLVLPAPPPQQAAAASRSGVTIINVGQAAPAVETSTEEAAAEQQRGLQVAVVANQNQQSGAQGAGRQGVNPARGNGRQTGGVNPRATGNRRPVRPNNNRPNNN